MRYTASIRITFIALLLTAVIVGCTESESSATVTPAPPQATALEAVELSKIAMSNLDSFSFQLTHDSGHTTLSGALELTRAGGLVTTNGLDLEAEANIGRAFVRVEAVVIDEQTWMTNPITGVWSEIPPEDSPFAFLDPVKMVADILGETSNPEYAPESSPVGEYRITGTIPAQSLATLVGSVDPNAAPAVILNFDASSNLLNRVEIRGTVQPEDEPGTIRIITLSEFDSNVSLEPPI